MRLSQFHVPTLKEAPRDAELVSHIYLVRGGYIRMLAAGVYDFLPIGVKVFRKVSEIIRDELEKSGAREVLLPAVQPADLWMESGRWNYYGPELLRFKDRHGREFCFGPTHEEVITDLVRRDVRSYRDLPLNLFQIQVKFRDEIKPRAGLMRGREFIMKDGYSFDTSIDAAKETYKKMYDAYGRIFHRCGLDHRAVEADTGNIGGSLSHEFQVIADTGEDYVFQCPECGFTVNQELAPLPAGAVSPGIPEGLASLEKVHTPGQHTVDQVTAFLGVSPEGLAKTLIYMADGKPVAVLVRGDHELAEVKLRRHLGCSSLEMADDATVEAVTSAAVGFAGPVGLKIPVLADWSLAEARPLVVGANESEHHLKNVVLGRDFQVKDFADLREAGDGDICGRCGKAPYKLFRGIEVGHVFYLGTKYSSAMNCTFLDENGKSQPVQMGCYGIGVTRVMAAAIEQNHDDKGICWPVSIAPFHVAVLPLQMKDGEVVAAADSLAAQLEGLGLEVLLDDRDERPGVKFKDADLIGLPWRVVISRKGLDAGTVELVTRATSETEVVPLEGLAQHLKAAYDQAMAATRPA